MWSRAASVGSIGLFALVGCSRTLSATTVQPNPMNYPADTLRQSVKLAIDIKDMDFPRTFFLRQSAYFAVVSKDRLRFHVQLVHKWEEVADITTWRVKLVDDRGNVYYPEAKEKRYDTFVTKMWDHELRTARRNRFGDVIGLRNDAYKRQVTMDSVDVFQGTGDYMFHAPGLFGRRIKALTLVMQRDAGTMEYRFTWRLMDQEAPELEAAAK